MSVRLLLSGFERFRDVPENPSELLVGRLAARPPVGTTTDTVVLPTLFGESARVLLARIEAFAPTHVVSFGVSSKSPEVHVERIAVNLVDADRTDNGGVAPRDTPVVPGGPAGYFATLPVRTVVSVLCEGGIKARASNSAGTFVCNDLFYRLMHGIGGITPAPAAGFVHLPLTRGMQNALPQAPSMDQLEQAVRSALEKL